MTDLFLLLIKDICWEDILKLKHNNSKKENKLANFPKESVETSYKTIKGLISFNFQKLQYQVAIFFDFFSKFID